MSARDRVVAAMLSVRVPVTGDALLYAGDDGKMPLYDADDTELAALADAVAPLVDALEKTVRDFATALKSEGSSGAKVAVMNELLAEWELAQ